MGLLPPIWLTIDTDDVFHHPKFQGHPKRSKFKNKQTSISDDLKLSFSQFEKWHLCNLSMPITFFVIGEQLECNVFKSMLVNLLSNSKKMGGEITIGCHGYTHTCWSAFNPNPEGFKKDLMDAKMIIKKSVGDFWRPWFRAPGGYIAPWMAGILKEEGFVLDSSINPTSFLSIKSGKVQKKFKFNGWKSVDLAMKKAEIIERPWLTTFYPALPSCGPALHIPILKIFAISTWKKYSNTTYASEIQILNPNTKITTVYWHLLDHSKKNGTWIPPLSKT